MSVSILGIIDWADWPYSGDTAFDVRAKSTQSWVTEEGEFVPRGQSRIVGTGSITGVRATLPAISLPSTDVGQDVQTARFTVTLHRTGKLDSVLTVLDQFTVPNSFEPTTTWGQIRINKNGKVPYRSTSVYTKEEVNNLLQQFGQGMFAETPSGTPNGVNGTFTLSRTPITGSVLLFLNGNLQPVGSLGAGTESYTISGATITHLLPPQTGDRLLAFYRTTGGLVAGGTIPTQMQEGGGPTVLSLGSIPDNLFFRRSGTTIIGDDPLLDPGNIVIGADTGAIGTSTVSLQTRGLNRLTITNAGNVNVVNKFGINTAVPVGSLHITPRYAAGVTAQEEVIRFTNTNGHYFNFVLSQTLQGGNPNDDVMFWGWNTDDSEAGEPSLRFAMERAFGTGAAANYEIHIEVHPTAIAPGADTRPWTWTINRTTGLAMVRTVADNIMVTGQNLLSVTTTETLLGGLFGATVSVPIRMFGDSVTFETFTNGGAPAKQLKVLPLAADLAQSTLVFGAAATGLQVYGVSGTLVVNDLNAGALGDVLMRRARVTAASGGLYVDANHVVGAQGAAVADATDAASVILRFNELLTRLRAGTGHGLIA